MTAGRIHINPDQSGYEARDTLLHEIMHAVLHQQGRTYEDVEEVYVRALATGLMGVMSDNPDLVTYLFPTHAE